MQIQQVSDWQGQKQSKDKENEEESANCESSRFRVEDRWQT